MAERVPARAIWMVVGAFAVTVFSVMGTLHVVSALAHEEYGAIASFSASGIETLEVHTDRGSVRIVGTRDDERIRVAEAVSDGLRETGRRVTREGSSLVVESTCPGFLSNFCQVDYTIRVPVELDVVVRAGDDVSVSDVRGDLDVAVEHGDLSIERIEGDARLASTHGSVSASFSSPPGTVDASSENGDVDVVLPRGEELYRVDASTDHGSTDVAVRQGPDAVRVVRAGSEHGDVTVRYPAR